MDNKFEILRILEIALNKRKKPPSDPKALMMAYARKLADKYRKEGDENSLTSFLELQAIKKLSKLQWTK